MADYAQYLNFDTEEDKIKQQQLYAETILSPQTAAAIAQIDTPQDWLIAAAPYCPDCRVFVPFVQKMAEFNPNIRLKYVARSSFDDRSCFDSGKQQEAVRNNQKIPALFRIGKEEDGAYFSEFPQTVLQQIAQDESKHTELRDACREGRFNADIEQQLVSVFLSAR